MRTICVIAFALMSLSVVGAQTHFDLTKNGTWKGVVVENSCWHKVGPRKGGGRRAPSLRFGLCEKG